jgi:hypothetical protein
MRGDLLGDVVVKRPDARNDAARQNSLEKLADHGAAERAGRAGDKESRLVGVRHVVFRGRQIRTSRPYGP